jgi:hypothetical protein
MAFYNLSPSREDILARSERASDLEVQVAIAGSRMTVYHNTDSDTLPSDTACNSHCSALEFFSIPLAGTIRTDAATILRPV